VRYRILYHHRTQSLDGQRVHINAIQGALSTIGHEVLEVAPLPATEEAGAPAQRTWRRRVLQSAAACAPRGAYEGLELAYNLAGFRALARTIRRVRPHFIYERYAVNTVAGVWASRHFGVPLLLEVNSPIADEKNRLGQLLFHRLSRRLERYTLTRATRVLAVSEVLAATLCQSAGIDRGKVVVVQNGADPAAIAAGQASRARIRHQLQCDDSEVLLGAAAFFREWHGIDQLLHAFSTIRGGPERARVLLVGDGPALPALRRTAAALGLQRRVIFAGPVPHDEMPGYLAAMDAVVIPRATEYASPLKLFEYMAAGKAVVAPRQPNFLEVLTGGHDALWFRPGDEQELASALAQLIGDARLRESLGRAARATLTARQLTWTGNAARIVNVFEQLEPRVRRRSDS
jgi:glycosyltransferase involved in cell wall biosynthesis